jgi:hypothetical protein
MIDWVTLKYDSLNFGSLRTNLGTLLSAPNKTFVAQNESNCEGGRFSGSQIQGRKVGPQSTLPCHPHGCPAEMLPTRAGFRPAGSGRREAGGVEGGSLYVSVWTDRPIRIRMSTVIAPTTIPLCTSSVGHIAPLLSERCIRPNQQVAQDCVFYEGRGATP